ncbi:MAG: hypothetical protein H6895_06695 [Defluviimonas sp.]|uniref:DUF6476 family protein n=1 Tax=Albidovulum sp. TaxID=1872424 RepID=UPI001D28D40D|nr:hypothetical protein [Paracoccaceae bacterium]MCC0063760.1 hypothetical protein [Defluviimonas sp.]
METAPDEGGSGTPPELRFLKALVTALAATMILGLITIIGLLVTRLPGKAPARPALPASIALPAGVTAEAVTMGRGWVAVVTGGNEIRVFDAETGALLQTVRITRP